MKPFVQKTLATDLQELKKFCCEKNTFGSLLFALSQDPAPLPYDWGKSMLKSKFWVMLLHWLFFFYSVSSFMPHNCPGQAHLPGCSIDPPTMIHVVLELNIQNNLEAKLLRETSEKRLPHVDVLFFAFRRVERSFFAHRQVTMTSFFPRPCLPSAFHLFK